ncbi:MAG: spondin domain-containing protein [Chloroflexota bacterium]
MRQKQAITWIVSIAILSFLSSFPATGQAQSGQFDVTASYQVTFESTWSQDTHPHPNGSALFPTNSAHFSGLIGGSHNNGVTLWQSGQLASLGIKRMAEFGSKGDLRNEVDAAINDGTAYAVISGGGIGLSPGSVTIASVLMNKTHPLVTLTSMIAPSPDWFVGVAGLSLLDDQGNWVTEKTVVLYPYDAGTDSGVDYTSGNSVTSPPEAIASLQGISPFSSQPIGTLTFKRTDLPQKIYMPLLFR